MFLQKRDKVNKIVEDIIYESINESYTNSIIEESLSSLDLYSDTDKLDYNINLLTEVFNIFEIFKNSNYNYDNLDAFKNSFDITSSFRNLYNIDKNTFEDEINRTSESLLGNKIFNNFPYYEVDYPKNGTELYFNINDKKFSINNQLKEEIDSGIKDINIDDQIKVLNDKLEPTKQFISSSYKKLNFIIEKRLLKEFEKALEKKLFNYDIKNILKWTEDCLKECLKDIKESYDYISKLSAIELLKDENMNIDEEFIYKLLSLLRKSSFAVITSTIILYIVKIYICECDNYSEIEDLYNSSLQKEVADNLNPFSQNLKLGSLLNKIYSPIYIDMKKIEKNNNLKNNFNILFLNSSDPRVTNMLRNVLKFDDTYTNIEYPEFKRSQFSVKYYHNIDALLDGFKVLFESFDKLLTTIQENPIETKINSNKLKEMSNKFQEIKSTISQIDGLIVSFRIQNI